jgi:perosamine synthetase
MQVATFERRFAKHVGARYAIGCCNGTATLHTALMALGIGPGCRVGVPPLTMASTALAVLHAGATPVFVDIDLDTWLMGPAPPRLDALLPVALYGLYPPVGMQMYTNAPVIMDGAQTVKPHGDHDVFTSYSFQASKHLSTGEGGMLVTDDEVVAKRARSYGSLGYMLSADSSCISTTSLKHRDFVRHRRLGFNYRMADAVASVGCEALATLPQSIFDRAAAAQLYQNAISRCDWLTPQAIPDGWYHDWWCYAIATKLPAQQSELQRRMHGLGAEVPYAAWRLSYREPALEHLPHEHCVNAEWLQPRLLQLQTNSMASAAINAEMLHEAISGMGG